MTVSAAVERFWAIAVPSEGGSGGCSLSFPYILLLVRWEVIVVVVVVVIVGGGKGRGGG